VSFQLVQDKVSLIDSFNVGDEVKVYFNLKGREWTSPQGETKYFNTIDAWKMEKLGGSGSGHNQGNQQQSNQNSSSSPVFTSNVADDDLPF
jgi:single-strand DNA-binding protein